MYETMAHRGQPDRVGGGHLNSQETAYAGCPVRRRAQPIPPVRAILFLQVFYIRTKIALELRTPKRGYNGIKVRFILEIAPGRVVHPCHEHPVMTTPRVTDPTRRTR